MTVSFCQWAHKLARTGLSGAAVLGLALSSVSISAQEIKPPAGFTSLFNGKSFEGWHGRPTLDPRKWAETPQAKKDEWNKEIQEHWKIEGDTIVNDGKGAYLTTNEEYGDIELLVDYKTVAKADSGIYLRGCPQVQIWDSTEQEKFKLGADKGSGGLWNNSPGTPGKDPLVLADKPFGQWNSFRIIQVGARTSVWLNGKQVVDHAIMENYFDRKLPLFAKGVIQLQTHGNEISWKNVFVRKLSADEANKFLSERDNTGFKSLFDGKSLDGWAGAVANYGVVDGAIQCKSGHGGVLRTKDQYKDFVARLEFKLPPGGNNGLAIRYPGEGDTAYTGMCELQVLDTEHPKYSKLDPRQAHGSAYGMAPAVRGHLRPVGEWNYQVVTVKGSTITVELNGTVILNTDLSTISQYMANSPHPGKDRTEGYFGFAGHNDPVQFRNVSIKSL